MSNNFVTSGSISVYPCGNRNPEKDPTARLNTEYNLVSIVNRIVDRKSFCITTFDGLAIEEQYKQEGDYLLGDIGEFLFNINGYLFTMSGGALSDLVQEQLNQDFSKYFVDEGITANKEDSPNTLYACICIGILNDQSKYKYNELLPCEANGTATAEASPTTSQTSTATYMGNMDNDTQFLGVTFLTYKYIGMGLRGEGWESSSTPPVGIFNEFQSSIGGDISVKRYILPIVQVIESKAGTTEEGEATFIPTKYSVPQDSRVKFSTITNGSVRSVTIDDGVLN